MAKQFRDLFDQEIVLWNWKRNSPVLIPIPLFLVSTYIIRNGKRAHRKSRCFYPFDKSIFALYNHQQHRGAVKTLDKGSIKGKTLAKKTFRYRFTHFIYTNPFLCLFAVLGVIGFVVFLLSYRGIMEMTKADKPDTIANKNKVKENNEKSNNLSNGPLSYFGFGSGDRQGTQESRPSSSPKNSPSKRSSRATTTFAPLRPRGYELDAPKPSGGVENR